MPDESKIDDRIAWGDEPLIVSDEPEPVEEPEEPTVEKD